MQAKFLMWNNHHLLCAVDTETTGLVAGYHDIIQIAVVPVAGDFKPYKEIRPFYLDLQPKRPENWDEEASRVTRKRLVDVMSNGVDPWKAADLFDEWFNRLNLGYEKRILPIAHNWSFDHGFLIDWLGTKSIDRYFDGRVRDTMAAALLINDRTGYARCPVKHPRVELKYLCNLYNIPHDKAHDALGDCFMTAALWREFVLGHEH